MGHCVSAKKKKNKPTLIIANRKNSHITEQIPNTLSIIINHIPNDTSRQTPVSIGQNMAFKELFIQLHINIYSDYELQLKDNLIIQNFDINKKIIETLYPYVKDYLNEVININLIYKGLQISENIFDSYIKYNTLIGSPIFDNQDFFAIIIFNTQNNDLKVFYREPKDKEYILMSKFNSFTAYCNAKGYLYISGGESELPKI